MDKIETICEQNKEAQYRLSKAHGRFEAHISWPKEHQRIAYVGLGKTKKDARESLLFKLEEASI